MSTLSNAQKSAKRYEALNKIAINIAVENDEFLHFCNNGVSGVTWRKLETFIKRKVESGAHVSFAIVEPSGGG